MFNGLCMLPNRSASIPHHHLHGWSLEPWSFYNVGGCATLWFPAPEWAHQLIDRLASSAWMEYPWMTEVFFVIPWVFQRDWGCVSKHVIERGTFAAGVFLIMGVPLIYSMCCLPSLLGLKKRTALNVVDSFINLQMCWMRRRGKASSKK
jgi:hypothetical protein